MAADFAKLDHLAFDARTADYEQAIRCHLMFEALVEHENWSNPAELLGEPVPYRALLSIAEARIARAESRPRSARVKELLEAAELAVAREPLTLFAKTLVDLGVSEDGLEKALEQVRRLHSGTTQHHHLPLAPPPEENPPPDEPPENPPPPEEPP